jgi:hypothetical protein
MNSEKCIFEVFSKFSNHNARPCNLKDFIYGQPTYLGFENQDGFEVLSDNNLKIWVEESEFLENYKSVVPPELPEFNTPLLPFQARVIDEAQELKDKMTKLANFVHSDKFSEITYSEQKLLIQQAEVMAYYYTILVERIEKFKIGE